MAADITEVDVLRGDGLANGKDMVASIVGELPFG
jgi:hypothetical protein